MLGTLNWGKGELGGDSGARLQVKASKPVYLAASLPLWGVQGVVKESESLTPEKSPLH